MQTPVTDQPAFITTVEGQPVIVKNLGPGRVWLGEDPTIQPSNGYLLVAGEEVEWHGPLFAVAYPAIPMGTVFGKIPNSIIIADSFISVLGAA